MTCHGDLNQIDPAKAPRNGAFDLLKVRYFTGYVDLEFIRPTAPVLFKTRPIADFEAAGVQASVFRLGAENLECVESIDTCVLE